MKKIFSILTLVSLLFAACEPSTTDDASSAIKLTSKDVLNIGCGSSMAYITYEIITPVEGKKVEATANVEWIGGFDYKQMGKILFNVERNPEELGRSAEIVVTYDNSSIKVIINQAGNPAPTKKVVEMPHLMGSYYGIQSGLYNYYLVFTDIAKDNNYKTPSAKYYFVDLYLMATPEDMSNITVPYGTYEFDIRNSGIPGTFTETYSWYQINDMNGEASSSNQISYQSGKLIIEEGKVTLDIALTIDGVVENHIVVYEGEYSLLNESM